MKNKNNQLFVKTMIITAIIALTTLMMTMFIGIKFFTEKKEEQAKEKVSLAVESPKVELSSTILGVVRNISETSINLFDIEKKQIITTKIEQGVKIEDAYKKAIPLGTIQQGDVVELVYEPQEDKLISINTTSRAWSKENLKKIGLNLLDQIVIIDGNEYSYTKDTLIIDEQGKESNIHLLGEYDNVKIIGVENKIWSIKILEKQGQLTLDKLPTYEGTLEIDTRNILQLSYIKDPIYLKPGKHKIVLNMDGYEPIVKQVEVTSGSEIKITPEGAKIAYTEVVLKVMNGVTNYTVEVEGKSYKPNEKISLQKGNYTFNVHADGYKPWTMQVAIEGDSKQLQALLTSQTPVDSSAANQGSTTQESGTETKTADYRINLSTDPEGASVYIGGIYKGTTPYKTTLPVGDYLVELKKEGYETYTTSLLIDNSDNQNSYLYVLKKGLNN